MNHLQAARAAILSNSDMVQEPSGSIYSKEARALGAMDDPRRTQAGIDRYAELLADFEPVGATYKEVEALVFQMAMRRGLVLGRTERELAAA